MIALIRLELFSVEEDGSISVVEGYFNPLHLGAFWDIPLNGSPTGKACKVLIAGGHVICNSKASDIKKALGVLAKKNEEATLRLARAIRDDDDWRTGGRVEDE